MMDWLRLLFRRRLNPLAIVKGTSDRWDRILQTDWYSVRCNDPADAPHLVRVEVRRDGQRFVAKGDDVYEAIDAALNAADAPSSPG